MATGSWLGKWDGEKWESPIFDDEKYKYVWEEYTYYEMEEND